MKEKIQKEAGKLQPIKVFISDTNGGYEPIGAKW